MHIVPKNLHTKYGLNRTEDKGVTKYNVFDSDSLTHWIHKIGSFCGGT